MGFEIRRRVSQQNAHEFLSQSKIFAKVLSSSCQVSLKPGVSMKTILRDGSVLCGTVNGSRTDVQDARPVLTVATSFPAARLMNCRRLYFDLHAV
jgi:hypothetical protein